VSSTAVIGAEGATRPLCPCHGVPRYRDGHCAVRERERNARRVRLSVAGEQIFLGRTQSAEEHAVARELLRQLKEVTSGRIHA
jgi:hypothetical protein